jgi:transposase
LPRRKQITRRSGQRSGSVAQQLGIGSSETLRKRIRQAEVDGGIRPSVNSEKHAETERPKREVAELRRANVL